MGRKRKIFLYVLICILVAVSLGLAIYSICADSAADSAVAAYAAEIPEEDSGEPPDGSTEDTETPEQAPSQTNVANFFDRIYEFWLDYSAEIITIIGDGALILYVIVKFFKSKKSLANIESSVSNVLKGVDNTISSQGKVVSVTNELIDGYNKFEKAINNFDATEQERYKTMLAAFAYSKAILEVLTTVYANSKNIPQGVKDLVNLKYADVLKLVGDESKLEEIAVTEESQQNSEGVDEPTTED